MAPRTPTDLRKGFRASQNGFPDPPGLNFGAFVGRGLSTEPESIKIATLWAPLRAPFVPGCIVTSTTPAAYQEGLCDSSTIGTSYAVKAYIALGTNVCMVM